MAEPKEKKEHSTTLPKWTSGADLPLLYANQFAVIRTPHEVVLGFGEFLPLEILGLSENEIGVYLKKGGGINPIARIAISYGGLKAFFAILKEQIEIMEKEGE